MTITFQIKSNRTLRTNQKKSRYKGNLPDPGN